MFDGIIVLKGKLSMLPSGGNLWILAQELVSYKFNSLVADLNFVNNSFIFSSIDFVRSWSSLINFVSSRYLFFIKVLIVSEAMTRIFINPIFRLQSHSVWSR